MGVIAFSDEAVWKIARHEYRRVLGCAKTLLDDDDDVMALEEAETLDGLHLDMTDARQAKRLQAALIAASVRLEAEINSKSDADAREEAFSVRLADLRRLLLEGAAREEG
jgi:hypothetical protein